MPKGKRGTTSGQVGISRRELLKCGVSLPMAAALSSGVWVGGCGKKRSPGQPSVILITVDTLRADHLGCYGYGRATSSAMDAFSKSSLLFERCISQGAETRLSFASMLTGYLPHETQIIRNIPLPDSVDTIADLLSGAGYRTAAVVSNYVLRRKEGWAQGFDVFDDTMEELERYRKWPERIAEPTTNRAIELLREHEGSPLFLWVHYQDPHGPYTPPAGYSDSFMDSSQLPRSLHANVSESGRGGIPYYQLLGQERDYYRYLAYYDGEIRYQNEHFGRLMQVLKELGHYDDSLIIVTSDHGEGMGEHSYYFAHGENLYNPLVHVPLMVRFGDSNVGRRSECVQLLDLVPTVLGVVGATPDERLRGRDLLKAHSASAEIYSEVRSKLSDDGLKQSLVYDGFKLIHTPIYKRYELYDLNADWYEEKNLCYESRLQGRIEQMKVRLDRLDQEDFLGLDVESKPRQLTPEEEAKLKSLGYVQ